MIYDLIAPIILFAAVAAIIFLIVRKLPRTKKVKDLDKSSRPQKKERKSIFKLSSQKFPRWQGKAKSGSLKSKFKGLQSGLVGAITARREKKAVTEKKDPAARVAEAKREIVKKTEPVAKPAPSKVKSVTEEDKSKIRNLSWEARKSVKKREYTEAEKYYRQILKIDKEDLDAYKGLGSVYMKMENFSDAADAYRQVIALGGRSERTYLDLGECFLKKESFEEAVDALEHVLKLNPQSGTAYALLGEAHTGMGLHKEALKDFEEAVKMDEKNVGYLLLLAGASARRGLKVEAKMHLRKVLDLEPENQKAQDMMKEMG